MLKAYRICHVIQGVKFVPLPDSALKFLVKKIQMRSHIEDNENSIQRV